MASNASYKILLVDANPSVLKLLELRLSQQGYQVFTADRAKDAVVTAIIAKPNLVIASLPLPDMDAGELRKVLGEVSDVAATPFIVLASQEDVQPVVPAAGGHLEVLRKPYAFEDLLVRIRGLEDESTQLKVSCSPEEGSPSEMTVLDIIQVLVMNRKTCTMTLNKENQSGEVYFRDGRIVGATAPGLCGEEAFYSLVLWRGADYCIGYESGNSVEGTISKDTRDLIAESFKQLEAQDLISQPNVEAQADEMPVFDVSEESVAEVQSLGDSVPQISDEVRFLQGLRDRGLLVEDNKG